MELRIGDYVRTKKDGIGRIISFSYQEDDECCFIELSNRRTGIKQFNIIKSSPNIIDLIEVGDYINGRYVDKYQGKLGNFYELPNGKWKFIEISNEHYLISSIVTKEQFESMEYKVKE